MKSGPVLVVLLGLATSCKDGARRDPAETARPDQGRASSPASRDGSPEDAGVEKDLWGVAAFFMTNVYEAPDFESRRLGWIRVGTRMNLRRKVAEGSRFCSDGWYALRDTPGFVCAGKGIVVGRMPRSVRYGSHPAALDRLNPYHYGFITRDGTPLYRRKPTREQQREVDAQWAAELAALAAASAPATDGGPARGAGDAGVREEAREVFDPSPRPRAERGAQEEEGAQPDEEDLDREEPVRTAARPAKTAARAAATEDDEEGPGSEEDEEEDGEIAEDEEGEEGEEGEEEDTLDGLLSRRMNKGNYVAVDRRVGRGGRLFYRTIRGRFVQANRLFMVGPPTFRGFELARGASPVPPLAPPDAGPPQGGGVDAGTDAGVAEAPSPALPAGIVYYWFARQFSLSKDGRRIFPRRRLERLTKFQIVEERQIGGDVYYDTGEGFQVKADHARKLVSRARPRFVAEGQKWIDVDVSEQTLVAYEGDRPVYATIVSTGLEDEEHMTPRGRFRIQSKHFTFTMADDRASDGPYSIEDVPYVMYFQLSYALHSAFWHGWYGRNRSHGCVNLAPADARWIFHWVDPQIPEGWYGVWTRSEEEGTMVVIRN